MLTPHKYLCGFFVRGFMEKEIKGWENYTVDEFGNVFSKKSGKFLRPFINKFGYLGVNLFENGKRKYFFVHRLVAEHFVENKENYKEVNHIDENKLNNYFENLEWCTRKYNNNYGTRLVKMRRKVICVETNTVFESAKDAEIKTGAKRCAISMVCNGKRETAGGYSWRYC